jgi:pyridinium-3,5-bisthiocarboxylic acid mononucleotide nickel chelatase
MRVLYFDCFAGLSGDMTVGALLDLGVEFEALQNEIAKLGLSGYRLSASRVKRAGFAATKFDVEVDEATQPARTFVEIREMIGQSSLIESVKAVSIQIFEKLAEAEARVHGSSVDRVHFHEVGAVDSIIDIVGAAIGFAFLGVEQYIASPLRVGFGFVKAAHGAMPIPAPGTAQLLRGIPIYAGDSEGEFVTPTGAAIVAALCSSFGAMPMMQIEKIGYGAGTRDPKGFPNVARLTLGETRELATEEPEITVIETNIDDMNPQAYGFVMDRAFQFGALDVFITPVQMKKDRPGALLTVLCEAKDFDALANLLLAETTTLGVRYYEMKRRTLERVFEIVETPYGKVSVKVARQQNRVLHVQPEYDDCVKLAQEKGVSLIEVQQASLAAYREKMKD